MPADEPSSTAVGSGSRTGSLADLADARLAYSQGTPQKGMCLHILDLDGGTGREVTCEEPGAQLGDLALTEDVLTCTRLTASTTPRRCKSIAVIDVGRAFGLRDQAAEDAARESDPCANWSAVALVTDSIDGRWLTTRVDDIGGTDEHLTLWRLDTGSLTGPTAR